MVTLLVTSAAILFILVIGLYFWQKPRRQPDAQLPPSPAPRGLFEAREVDASKIEASDERQQKRLEILKRAGNEDKRALQDAHALRDRNLYDEALERLTNTVNSDAKLLALISYLTRAELPVSTQLAKLVLAAWKKSPDRSSTAKTLHIVALANDPSLYNAAVEDALAFWREGRLPEVSPHELRALLEGEFWLLSSKVRGSGAGFLLKRTLANARRELQAETHINQ